MRRTDAGTLRDVGPLHRGVWAFVRIHAFAFTGIAVVEGHSKVLAVVATLRALKEAVDRGGGGRPPKVKNHNFKSVAATERSEVKGNDVGPRKLPVFDEGIVEVDLEEARRGEGDGDRVLGTVRVKGYLIGGDPPLWPNLP